MDELLGQQAEGGVVATRPGARRAALTLPARSAAAGRDVLLESCATWRSAQRCGRQHGRCCGGGCAGRRGSAPAAPPTRLAGGGVRRLWRRCDRKGESHALCARRGVHSAGEACGRTRLALLLSCAVSARPRALRHPATERLVHVLSLLGKGREAERQVPWVVRLLAPRPLAGCDRRECPGARGTKEEAAPPAACVRDHHPVVVEPAKRRWLRHGRARTRLAGCARGRSSRPGGALLRLAERVSRTAEGQGPAQSQAVRQASRPLPSRRREVTRACCADMTPEHAVVWCGGTPARGWDGCSARSGSQPACQALPGASRGIHGTGHTFLPLHTCQEVLCAPVVPQPNTLLHRLFVSHIRHFDRRQRGRHLTHEHVIEQRRHQTSHVTALVACRLAWPAVQLCASRRLRSAPPSLVRGVGGAILTSQTFPRAHCGRTCCC